MKSDYLKRKQPSSKSLINLVSRQVEDKKHLANTNGKDSKAIFLLVCLLIIYKDQFEDIFYNRFKSKNILKLSTSYTIIKHRVKYIKVGDNIELETHNNNYIANEAKSITQLLQYFLFYWQIIIQFATTIMQFELSTALATYDKRFLAHSMVYK